MLRKYVAAEAFMFKSIAPELPTGSLRINAGDPEPTSGNLEARITKLRMIIRRVYERSPDRAPPIATPDPTD